MWISEQLLYLAARTLYRSEVAHSREMKESLASRESYGVYRSSTFLRIEAAAKRFNVPIADGTVLDLGCSDGAISKEYLNRGASEVIGLDIDHVAIAAARKDHSAEPRLSFFESNIDSIPLPNNRVDTIICFDVFEHVSRPAEMLRECHRVLRPGGAMLIGTWGWKHPFAPHLWSTMPVPWAHCLVSERTLLRTCRRVYHSNWYVPNMHDLDQHGQKIADRYTQESISTDYLNKLLVSDFERLFCESDFEFQLIPEPFSSRFARWTRIFLQIPWIREFITAYIWVVLRKK